jgi:hypothetical protein
MVKTQLPREHLSRGLSEGKKQQLLLQKLTTTPTKTRAQQRPDCRSSGRRVVPRLYVTREARESKPHRGHVLTENARGSRTVKRTRGWRPRPDEGCRTKGHARRGKKIGSGLGGRLKIVIKPNPNPNPWL